MASKNGAAAKKPTRLQENTVLFNLERMVETGWVNWSTPDKSQPTIHDDEGFNGRISVLNTWSSQEKLSKSDDRRMDDLIRKLIERRDSVKRLRTEAKALPYRDLWWLLRALLKDIGPMPYQDSVALMLLTTSNRAKAPNSHDSYAQIEQSRQLHVI